MQQLLDVGISTRRGIMCSHREPAYAGQVSAFSLRESESAQDSSVLLPLYPGMLREDQDQVVVALRNAIEMLTRVLHSA
jgi:dTDP-4-amino-4,6-dideoxygalactose transaminase